MADIKIMGEDQEGIRILGEDQAVDEEVTQEVDPFAAAMRRLDESLIVATGGIPSDAEQAAAYGQLSLDTQRVVMDAVQETLSDPNQDPQTAAERLLEIQEKGQVVAFSDYWELERQALMGKDPEFGSLQALSALKFQILVETLEDRIRTAGETGPGGVMGWLDRYIARGTTIGAVEGLTGRSKREGDEFLAALSGPMTAEEFMVFLEEKIDGYMEEGVFFNGNWAAMQDLLEDAVRRGDDAGVLGEFIFGAIDLAFPIIPVGAVAGKTSKALIGLRKSATTATQAGLTGGHEAATAAAKAIVRVTDEPENLAGMTFRMFDPVADQAPVRPLVEAAQDAQTYQELFKEVTNYVRRAVGDAVDPDLVLAAIDRRATAVKNAVGRPLNDAFFDMKNNTIAVRIGHYTTGAPVSERTAKTISKGIPGSEVVKLGDKKFVVEVKEAVNPDTFVKVDQKPVEVVGGWLGRKMQAIYPNVARGSYLRDADVLSELAQRAETAELKLREATSAFGRDIEKMSGREFDEVGEVVADLNLGSLSKTRNWFDEDGFVEEFKRIHGKNPSKRQVKGYSALVQLSDYSYVTQGWMLVRKMQREGFRQITVKVGDELQTVAARQISELPPNATHVAVGETGQIVEYAKYKGKKANLYAMDFEVGNGIVETRYVADVSTIRSLEPSDVLGYNAGGPRINPTAKQFISFEVDGKVVRVAMSATSEKEAIKAVEELQRLVDAANSGSLTDELVQNNRSWYSVGDMDTADDFLRLAKDEGWDLTKEIKVNRRARDSRTFIASADDVFVATDSTIEDFYKFNNRRSDRPLLHYGGARTYNDNPIKSIVNQVNSVNRKIAYETYNDAAISSMGQAVKKMVGPKPGYGIRDYFANMETLLEKNSTDELTRTLLERKRIFELRNGVPTEWEAAAQRITDRALEKLYDLTGISVKIGGPADNLNKFGFFNTFFADPFQLVLQSSQVGAMFAQHGTRAYEGAVLGRWLMKSLKLPYGSAEFNLAIEGMSKRFGMSKEEILDLRQAFTDIGRYEIDPSGIAEGYENASFAASGVSKKIRVAGRSTGKAWDTTTKAGLYFFNKGEQIARVTAFGISALLFRKENPLLRFNSKQALSFISNKEQALTLYMNQSNKSRVQQGLAKVPTQFYSYMLRTYEAVVFGKNLTKAERIGLLVYVAPFWGLTGLGIGEAADSVIDFFGVEKDGFAAETIRNGPLEGLLDWAFDGEFDVGLASRLSIGDGIRDTLRSFQQESLLEVIAGAGGGKTGAFAANLFVGLGNILTGQPHYGKLQLAEALRENRLIDNLSKAQGIWANDVYTSKTGKRIQGLDLSTWETIGVALGIPPGEVQDFYVYDSIRYGSERDYTQRAKALDVAVTSFYEALGDDDSDRAEKILAEIEALIVESNLTEVQKGRLRSRVMNGVKDKTTLDLYLKLIRLGKTSEAEAVAELVGN